MKMAFLTRERSTCLRRKVGAVLVLNNHVISTGYNGPAKGLKHCSEVGCIRDGLKVKSGERLDICRAVHAEVNTIAQAAERGISVKGSTLFVTNHPCLDCLKLLINAGVERVVFYEDYNHQLSKKYAEESHITVEPYKGKPIQNIFSITN